jgi:hypothetical protein
VKGEITLQRSILVIVMLAIALAATASATTISYEISIDTSSVSGTQGGIYLDFSPGSDVTEVDISAFSPVNGLAGGPLLTDGGANGTLDGNDLVFVNDVSAATNDYGELLTFGPTLSFIATFDSPFKGSSGSEFDVALTGGDLFSELPTLTYDSNGNNASITTDGSGNFTTMPTDSTIAQVSSTPEASTGTTFIVLGLLTLCFRLKINRTGRSHRQWSIVSVWGHVSR